MWHAYAQDLALYVTRHWGDTPSVESNGEDLAGSSDPPPDQTILANLISCCYQASLMREEDRPVRFRLILSEPSGFETNDGPPTGLYKLLFNEPQPLDEYALKRLSPAADFYRSLIGVRHDTKEGLLIWGIVHSGSRWVKNIYSESISSPSMLPSLVIYVTDPGRITVSKGPLTIATLNRGQIITTSNKVFDSAWLSDSFASVRSRLWKLHLDAKAAAEEPWQDLDPGIVKTIARQVVRRIISSVRNSGHGGTVLVIPPEMADQVFEENPYLSIEYKVTDKATRSRFQTLLVNLINTLARTQGREAGEPFESGECAACSQGLLARFDEAIFELAYLFADLTAVDGAVVFSEAFELLGFGAMISGGLKGVKSVARARDVEGLQREPIPSGSFGARHRSVYRLCNAVHEAIAIVISQDRLVRFVKWKDDMVTFWDHVATNITDF